MEGRWLRLVEAGRRGMRIAPETTRESAGSGATAYTGWAGGQRLRLRVTASACADSMSGESFPLTATLMLDGRELRGCARRLGASPDGG